MQHRVLAWVGGLVGGTILIALLSLLVITRAQVQTVTDADSLPPAGLPGTTSAPAPPRDTAVAAAPADPNQKIPNIGPLDSVLAAMPPSARQRTALDRVLRKGIVYDVKETKPNVIRYFVGAAFFSEPDKYRNPAVRDLYHAQLATHNSKEPLYLEFWGNRYKYCEYSADTFYFGPRYTTAR